MKRIRFTLFVAAVTTVLYLAAEARQGLFSSLFSLKISDYRGFRRGGVVIHRKRMARLASRELPLHWTSGRPGNECFPGARLPSGEVLCGDVRRPGRIVYMDWLRVLAAVLVVALHIIRSTVEKLPVHTPSWEFFWFELPVCGVQRAVCADQRGADSRETAGRKRMILFSAFTGKGCECPGSRLFSVLYVLRLRAFRSVSGELGQSSPQLAGNTTEDAAFLAGARDSPVLRGGAVFQMSDPADADGTAAAMARLFSSPTAIFSTGPRCRKG